MTLTVSIRRVSRFLSYSTDKLCHAVPNTRFLKGGVCDFTPLCVNFERRVSFLIKHSAQNYSNYLSAVVIEKVRVRRTHPLGGMIRECNLS